MRPNVFHGSCVAESASSSKISPSFFAMLAMVVREQPFALMLGGTDRGSAAPGRPAIGTRILAADSLQMQPIPCRCSQPPNRGSILGCGGLCIPPPDAAAKRGSINETGRLKIDKYLPKVNDR
jgi:hypothetical protein